MVETQPQDCLLSTSGPQSCCSNALPPPARAEARPEATLSDSSVRSISAGVLRDLLGDLEVVSLELL